MTGLENLVCGSFTPHLGTVFRALVEDDVHELRLVEAAEVGTSGAQDAEAGCQSFSIVFQGPAGLYIPQGTYRLEHEKMGHLDLFLVPIQPIEEGSRFEAVFT